MSNNPAVVKRSIISKLWEDNRSRMGMIILIVSILIAVFGSYVRPDKTKNANGQHLVLAKKKPGYVATLIKVRLNEEHEGNFIGQGLFFGGLNTEYKEIPIASYSVNEDVLYYIPLDEQEQKQIAMADVLFSLNKETYKNEGSSVVFQTITGDQISMTHSELQSSIEKNIVEKKYYLGTDTFGRDLLSRLMGGVIFSLSVGLISVLISLVIGISLGAIAGYYRGFIDKLIMWFVNVIWSIPTLLMVIAITLVMGKGFVQVFIAVGLTMWVEVARVVRGQIISVRELDYVEATKALGYSEWRIITKHILPNIMGPVIVISAANFASAILIEAGLSFLGIGTQIPMPSWGMMIKDHYPFITTDLAYLAVIPGICIMIMVLSFMLIGNRLRDIYDVRSTS